MLAVLRRYKTGYFLPVHGFEKYLWGEKNIRQNL
jgi:hypothetical protein